MYEYQRLKDYLESKGRHLFFIRRKDEEKLIKLGWVHADKVFISLGRQMCKHELDFQLLDNISNADFYRDIFPEISELETRVASIYLRLGMGRDSFKNLRQTCVRAYVHHKNIKHPYTEQDIIAEKIKKYPMLAALNENTSGSLKDYKSQIMDYIKLIDENNCQQN